MRKLSDRTLKSKKERGLCSTPFCIRKRDKHRTVCHRCKKRRDIELHPLKYKFYNLRTHARQRGKEFTLTLAQFEEVIAGSGYVEKTGHGRNALTIDRINHKLGYIAGNIRVIPKYQNSSNGHYEGLGEPCPF